MVKLITTANVYEALRLAAETAADKTQEFVLFTEDRCTATLERAVLKRVEGGVCFHAEVTTFSRFLQKRLGAVPALGKQGSTMLIRRILSENEGQFSLLPPVGGKKNLTAALYDMLAQMKSACVGKEELLSAAKTETGLLNAKLTDLALLSEKYEEALSRTGKTDQSGLLSLLPPYLINCRPLAGKRVILAGYTAFTKQMQRVVSAIVQSGANVTAILPAGTAMRAQGVEGFFSAVKRAGEEVEKEEALPLAEAPAAAYLRQNLFSVGGYVCAEKKPAPGVGIYRAQTAEEEVERLALSIIRRVREGARYRDFSVVVQDMQTYQPLLIRIFGKYGIPFYTDVKYALSRAPLTRFVLAALSVGAHGATLRTVGEVVKNAYFPTKEGVPAFLAYVKRAGVIGKRFYEPFTLPLPDLDQAERVRAAFAALCPPLPQKASAKEYAAFTTTLLSAVRAEECGEELMKTVRETYPELADFTRQAPARFSDLLSETERILGDIPLILQEFADLILAGAQADETGVLPTRVDAVTVAPPDKACIRPANHVCVLGATADFPAVTQDTAFLSERDLLALEEGGLIIDPNVGDTNERSREQAVYALTAFFKTLTLSYPVSIANGGENRESEVISFIKRCALTQEGEPLYEITEAEMKEFLRTLPAEEQALRAADGYITEAAARERFFKGVSAYAEGETDTLQEESGYYAYLKKKDAENGTTVADGLSLEETLSTGLRGTEPVSSVVPGAISATALQQYFSCPYAYFLEKTVGVTAPKEARVESTESGTLMHAVYEAFGKEMISREVLQGEIPSLVEKIFAEVSARPEFFVKRGSVRNEVAFSRLKEEALRGCAALHAHFMRSSLRISAVEKNLNESFALSPLRFTVGGRTVPLTGVVDRIDENEEFFRIVDYKTGSVECKTKELFVGKHIQLELYLLAVKNLLNKRPVGGYYFFSTDKYEEEQAPILLYGKTVKDEAALAAQDASLAAKDGTPQESIVLPFSAKMNAKGERVYEGAGAKSLLLSEDVFEAHLNYAFAVAEKALCDMESGFIYPTPYEGQCDWCKYGGICGRSEYFYGKGREVSARVDHNEIENAVILAKGEKDAR